MITNNSKIVPIVLVDQLLIEELTSINNYNIIISIDQFNYFLLYRDRILVGFGFLISSLQVNNNMTLFLIFSGS